jgi:hypothetical protein
VNDDHGVLPPRCAASRVAHATAEIDDFFAVPIDATSSAELAAPREILKKCRANGLVPAAYGAFDVDRLFLAL